MVGRGPEAGLAGRTRAGGRSARVERAGTSVEVLPTAYAKCLDGQQAAYNERIDALLDG
ncbi:hypothetical protein [Pseudonocardia sp. H11422]|uniref:hypothetical protein n=1 Tax=Pseudonocardia sp. H11422 TaxID=2835866 RepID=UPI001BDD3BDD|nr:hypothetical protein [Pseudonocardia sp. H11422]